MYREKGVKFVHLLGKDARSKIISVLASTRSYTELSRLLGVSTAAISKYLKGKTHPSDHVMLRAIEQADEREKEIIADIIINELGDGLRDFILWAMRESLLKREHLRRIEEILYEAYIKPPRRSTTS
jgi:predicted transcriptional regulator